MDKAPIIRPVRDASVGFGLLPRWLCPWVMGPMWRLMDGYDFSIVVPPCMATCGPLRYHIPAGYEFDKASIPPLFWGPPFNYIPDGLCTDPALEHDFLCDLLTGGSEWLEETLGKLPDSPPAWMVHEHFRLRLHEAGVRRGKAEAMGRAVALFGPQGRAWPWVKAAAILSIFYLLYQFLP